MIGMLIKDKIGAAVSWLGQQLFVGIIVLICSAVFLWETYGKAEIETTGYVAIALTVVGNFVALFYFGLRPALLGFLVAEVIWLTIGGISFVAAEAEEVADKWRQENGYADAFA